MENPQISQIHFTNVRPREGLIGFVQFVLDEVYAVGGVGVHTRLGSEGVRLLYPTKKLSDGTNIPLFYPLTKEIGESIEKSVYITLKSKGMEVIYG